MHHSNQHYEHVHEPCRDEEEDQPAGPLKTTGVKREGRGNVSGKSVRRVGTDVIGSTNQGGIMVGSTNDIMTIT